MAMPLWDSEAIPVPAPQKEPCHFSFPTRWPLVRLARIQNAAHRVDGGRGLIASARQNVTQLLGGAGISVQHLEEEAARDAQHRGGLERGGGRRAPSLGDQGQLSDEGAA